MHRLIGISSFKKVKVNAHTDSHADRHTDGKTNKNKLVRSSKKPTLSPASICQIYHPVDSPFLLNKIFV